MDKKGIKDKTTSEDNKNKVNNSKSGIKSTDKPEIKPEKRKKKLYFSYNFKVITSCLLFIICFISSILLIKNSLKYEDKEIINYNEKSSLDYKVNIKTNNFYDTNTLDKDMVYVASLIDSIDTYFNYNFDIDNKLDISFTYSIIAKLMITDSDGKNTYFEKEYVLLKDKTVNIEETNHKTIAEKIKIDYQYYNNIANGFKSTYAVDSNSNLIVTMKVKKISNDPLIKINNNISSQSINIPLSEKSVNIKLNYVDINNESTIINDKNVYIDNIIGICISIVLLIISIITMIKSMRLIGLMFNKKSKYDKYISKILKEYDRLIVESYTIVDFNNYEIIKVNKFEELLDVRDNLKVPINYYIVTPHQKSYFYIVSTNIYLYTVKAIDIEKEK